MEATETPPTLISFKDLIEMLGTSNPDKNRWATATLIQAGQPILSRLVSHAADPAKTATHRVKILKAIQGIGYPSNPLDQMTLFGMTFDAPPSVRQAVGRLIKHLRFEVPDKASTTPAQPIQPGDAESVSTVCMQPES